MDILKLYLHYVLLLCFTIFETILLFKAPLIPNSIPKLILLFLVCDERRIHNGPNSPNSCGLSVATSQKTVRGTEKSPEFCKYA